MDVRLDVHTYDCNDAAADVFDTDLVYQRYAMAMTANCNRPINHNYAIGQTAIETYIRVRTNRGSYRGRFLFSVCSSELYFALLHFTFINHHMSVSEPAGLRTKLETAICLSELPYCWLIKL